MVDKISCISTQNHAVFPFFSWFCYNENALCLLRVKKEKLLSLWISRRGLSLNIRGLRTCITYLVFILGRIVMDHRIVCPNCSHIVPAGSSFCPKCGCPTNDDEKTVHVISPGYSAYLPGGTVLQGKYRINHVLGQGGFGITYDGTDLKLQMHIAIKEYFPRQVAERFSGNTYNVTCTQSAQIMYICA